VTAPVVVPSARGVALVADIDCSARQTLVWELAVQGYALYTSDTCDETLALARRCRPNLVVLELKLRTGSTFELLGQLHSELPEAKLVVLTSYGSVASAVRALRLGATDYLCKPARAGEVLRALMEPRARDLLAADASAANDSLTLDEAIWEYIHHTLEVSGSISEAARRLGVFRQSLKRMISKYRPANGGMGLRPERSVAGGGR